MLADTRHVTLMTPYFAHHQLDAVLRTPPPHHPGGGANLPLLGTTCDSIHCLDLFFALRFVAAVSYTRVPVSPLLSRRWPPAALPQLQRPKRQIHPRPRRLLGKLRLHNHRLVLCSLGTTANAEAVAAATFGRGRHQELHLHLETAKLLASNTRTPNDIAAW
jgi:hypothetical protein